MNKELYILNVSKDEEDVEDAKLRAPAAIGVKSPSALFHPVLRQHWWYRLLSVITPWRLWLLFSCILTAVLLVDPLFNRPLGLISTSLFTGRPADHGDARPCSYDFEGSWQIGMLFGSTPLVTQLSNQSALSCWKLGNSSASYISEPYMLVPTEDGRFPVGHWFAFYQVKNLRSGHGEIGVAQSKDAGKTWEHLDTALSAPTYSLSSPWVVYDQKNRQYIMIPDTHKAHRHSVQLYTASQQDFPFGWKYLKTVVEGSHFLDTTGIHYQGRWWMFSTVKSHRGWWGERSYSLRLFHTTNLTGTWEEHPMSPISTDSRYARSGGRPLMYDGHVYRWAQDDSNFYGQSLHLIKVTQLDLDTYMEAYVRTIEPSGDGNWYSSRTHHVDLQQVGSGGTWMGLIDGDMYRDGMRHFYHHGAKFVRVKNTLLRIVVLQLALLSFIGWLWQSSDKLFVRIMRTLRTSTSGKAETGWSRLWGQVCHGLRVAMPELELVGMLMLAWMLTAAAFSAVPSAFYCPRWAVKVDVPPSPPVRHQDPRAPYDVSDLVVVTGATASFFDRMTNMLGSLHTWEPKQHIIIYDLGFSQSQLAKMMCWDNVELRRFPYEKYPPHVSNVANYAFKTLVIEDALRSHAAVLWIDSGLELRAPLTTMRQWLTQYGHVSALQEDSIGDPMYTLTPVMADFYGLTDRWDEIKKWQFCAGGLQGFVRGSDAERLVLSPVINCSMTPSCIAPPGASRENHNFDQTALTMMIWANGFSCLPRETHCMWSVKKTSRDPLQLSAPIEIVSRGHRLPKPYAALVGRQSGCIPDKARVPWAPMKLPQKESLNRYDWRFRVSRIYAQPVFDELLQTAVCVGAHSLATTLFVVQVGLAGMGVWASALRGSWKASRRRCIVHAVVVPLALAAFQLSLYTGASEVR